MTAADIVIHSASIFDGTKRLPDGSATAVAIRDHRILSLGTDGQIRAFSGPNTTVLDAQGAALLPGFVDAHIHAAFAGVERLGCDLTGATTQAETYQLISEYAQSSTHDSSPDDWIIGGGWSHELFEHPARQELDALVPNRPIALSDAGHHTLWVNTAALKLAGIDATTPEPANGTIHREPDGYPTGYLNETATELINAVIPPVSDQQIAAGLRNAQEYLWSLGITGWHEAILGNFAGYPDASPAYRALIDSGELSSKVSGALWIPRGLTRQDIPDLVHDFIRRRASNVAAGFASSTAKAMVDGVPHGGTAALLEPYCPYAQADGTGELHIQPDVLTELATALDAEDFALHFHVMGDRGGRVALDAIETARRKNGIRGGGPRHHLAHVTMVHHDDIARFGALGVTANIQALWATPDAGLIPMVGQDRADQSYLFRAMVDSGADIAMGSDWPVSSPDPWDAIHTAVNRTHPAAPAETGTLDTKQALGMEEALTAYTSGSSSLVLGSSGRLRVGERADLLVTDRDPFELDQTRLAEVQNRFTIVNGELVYSSELQQHAAQKG